MSWLIRRQTIWPVLSAIFFAIAIYLVRVVEQPPNFNTSESQSVSVSFDPSSSPGCIPASFICDMADAVKPDAVAAIYSTSASNSWISFELPSGSFIIILNNLEGDSCKIYPQPLKFSDLSISSNRSRFKITEAKAQKYGDSPDLRRLIVSLPMDSIVKSYGVVCGLQSVRQNYTFSKYQVVLYLGDDDSSNSTGVARRITAIQKVTFNFSEIPAADEFSFEGGGWPEKMENVEATRVISPNNRLVVRWTDANREQLKEVLLIVIGTLIAFGVGTFIEWIRPVVDDDA